MLPQMLGITVATMAANAIRRSSQRAIRIGQDNDISNCSKIEGRRREALAAWSRF
ncbi:MAG: hypothetical protein AB7F35_20815 [Acetobacteraceae bacterium]